MLGNMYTENQLEIRVYLFSCEVTQALWESPALKNHTFKVVAETYYFKGKEKKLLNTRTFKVKGREVSYLIERLKEE